MSGGGTQNSLRKALGAIKDTTTVSLAKVNSEYKVRRVSGCVFFFAPTLKGSVLVKLLGRCSFVAIELRRSWTSLSLRPRITSSALRRRSISEVRARGCSFFFWLLSVRARKKTILYVEYDLSQANTNWFGVELPLLFAAIFAAVSATRPRADVAYCIHALARRLSKTHNWAVCPSRYVYSGKWVSSRRQECRICADLLWLEEVRGCFSWNSSI